MAAASNATYAPGGETSCGEDGASRQINQRLYPLIVYLHSAGACEMGGKEGYQSKQLNLVTQEAPHSVLVDGGQAGVVDDFIGIAPCCPPPDLTGIVGYSTSSVTQHRQPPQPK
jgi:hypothetical protein